MTGRRDEPPPRRNRPTRQQGVWRSLPASHIGFCPESRSSRRPPGAQSTESRFPCLAGLARLLVLPVRAWNERAPFHPSRRTASSVCPCPRNRDWGTSRNRRFAPRDSAGLLRPGTPRGGVGRQGGGASFSCVCGRVPGRREGVCEPDGPRSTSARRRLRGRKGQP